MSNEALPTPSTPRVLPPVCLALDEPVVSRTSGVRFSIYF